MAGKKEALVTEELSDPFQISEQLATQGVEFEEEIDDQEEVGATEEELKETEELPSAEETEEEETVESSEEEEDEEDEQAVEESEEDDEDDEDEELSGAALLAYSYQKDGLLPEDFEINSEMTGLELKEALKESLKETVRPEVELEIQEEWREAGYDKQALELAQVILQGGNTQELSRYGKYKRFAEYQTEDEGEMERYIKAEILDKGLDAAEADEVVDAIPDAKALKKRYQKSQEYFGQKSKEILEAERRAAAEETAALKAQQRKQEEAYREQIKSRKIGDLTLDDQQAARLEEFLLKPSVTKVNGNKLRTAVTPFNEWLATVSQDQEKVLQLALFAMEGKKFFEKQGATKKADEFMSKLDGKTTKRTTKRRKKRNPKVERSLESWFAEGEFSIGDGEITL